MLIHPFVSTHVAHAVEVSAVFDGNAWGSDIADENPRLLDLNLGSGRHRAVDLAAGHQDRGGYNPLDDRLFPDDQGSCGVDFTFDAAIDTDRSIKVDDPFEIDTFP